MSGQGGSEGIHVWYSVSLLSQSLTIMFGVLICRCSMSDLCCMLICPSSLGSSLYLFNTDIIHYETYHDTLAESKCPDFTSADLQTGGGSFTVCLRVLGALQTHNSSSPQGLSSSLRESDWAADLTRLIGLVPTIHCNMSMKKFFPNFWAKTFKKPIMNVKQFIKKSLDKRQEDNIFIRSLGND